MMEVRFTVKIRELDEIVAAELKELAGQLALQSGNCAQSSFAALDDYFSLDGAQVVRALTPLPGIALRGETCGVVTGCLLALGLVYGRDDLADEEAMRRSLPPTREFCRRFENRFGSTSCDSVLEKRLGRTFDLAKMEEFKEYCGCGGTESCAEVVEEGVLLAASILLSQPQKPDSGVMLTV
jgi:C_GCAxxG_C_C family probable redox protein